MNTGKMKNIIVLKNLPSNLIEEAIVVVKNPEKIKKHQYVDTEQSKQTGNKQNKKEIKTKTTSETEKNQRSSNEYIVKEAEMVISNYINNLETKSPKWKNNMKKLEKRYKKSLKVNVLLGFATVISLILSII